MAKDYYLILGVKLGATQEEIKQGYRLRVLQLHPDSFAGGAGPFLEVQEAYGVLGDPARRAAYDRSLARPASPARWPTVQPEPLLSRPRRRAPVEPLKPAARPVDLGEISLARSFQTSRPSFEDILGRIWANWAAWQPKGQMPRGLTVDIPISQADALSGGQARVLVPALVTCPACGGSGGVAWFRCRRCDGQGTCAEEVPIRVEFPPGTPDGYTVNLRLDRLGIRNLYLIVRFCLE